MQTTEYSTKRIDHLGIVAGICNKIGLIETIDEQVGEDDRKVSVGQAVQAMVLNGLGFVGRPLYLTPEFFANKPVEVLIGPEIEAADLNDDSLGRALDRLFETGVTELFAAVAGRGLSVFEIGQRFRHLDSTTFSLHGQYDRETDERAIEITYGYSKDHRPDLKQTVLALICSQQSAIPSWLAVLNGNQSDKQSFVEIIHAYRTQLEASHDDDCYYVADSALYSADNIQTLSQVLWLTRVPATLKAVKQLYRQVDPAEMQAAQEAGYRFRELGSSYGQVRQRWALIFSEAAYQREVTTLNQHIAREQAQASQALRRLAKQEFDTAAAAQEALAQQAQSWRFHQIEGSTLQSVPHYDKPGRPGADQEPDYFTWQIEGQLGRDEETIAAERQTKGKFVLATNQLDQEKLSADAMIQAYKQDGVSAERGFRFLKDPLFFAHSLFLKKPERIMALLMIMGLSLLIYALAEYHLRQQLQHHHQTIPDQLGKPTARPTMRRIFQLFEGIDILIVHDHPEPASPPERHVLNLTPLHHRILNLLGPEVEYCYQP